MSDMEDGDEGMEFVEEETDSEDEGEDGEKMERKVYLPGQPMDDNERLVMDESAYVMYHQAQTGAPCLSFDMIQDPLGDNRQEFPLTLYVVAGTQAERSNANNVIVMKMSNLKKTKEDDDKEESESESEEEMEDEKPELETAMMKHNGGVNRIRSVLLGDRTIAASWSELGQVHIWDLTRPLLAVNDSHVSAAYHKNQESPPPVFSFAGHQMEGFALDFSPVSPGVLATGDCSKNIHLWKPQEGGTWHVDQRPCVGHTASVEDIQWSPSEFNVFASCSVDRTIRIWDSRAQPSKCCMLTTQEAHDRDVNVISWSKNEPFIISGGDDGMLKIWDLRQFQKGKAMAVFKHHTAPITSVEWHFTDSSVFAASGSDNQLTIWDLALERDNEAQSTEGEEPSVPPQLLFIHQGQKDIKELHWHAQCPGIIISTALTGFNVFRTISV